MSRHLKGSSSRGTRMVGRLAAAIESLESRQLLTTVPWATPPLVTATSAGASLAPAALAPASLSTSALQPLALGQPSVLTVTPSNATTGVKVDAFVSCEVNIPNSGIDADTLTADTVYLVRNSDGVRIPAVLNTSGGGDVIVLRPETALSTNTAYTFYVTAGVRDLSGVGFTPFQSTFTTSSTVPVNNSPVAFEQVELPSTKGHQFSCVIMRDYQLYASTLTGQIFRFPLLADGTLGPATIIDTVRNHEGGDRFIVGMAFDPASTPDNHIIWISHTAVSGLQLGEAQGPDWSGKISRLSGPNLSVIEDKVINLPRSVRDHLTNQLSFGPDGKIYFAQSANTAMGAPDVAWGMRPEHLLTATILQLDPNKLGSTPLDVHTEDADPYDPYAPDAPLKIYATGIRNAYDLVFLNGRMYAPTNGSAAGGATPAGNGVPGIARVNEPETDALYLIQPGGYYGHPNPLQNHYVLNGGNPTSGKDPYEVAQYPVGTQPESDYQKPIYDFGAHQSPDGAVAYSNSSVFGGALKGKILVTRYSGGDDIIVLTVGTDGQITKTDVGLPGLTGLNNPVDIMEHRKTGNLYVTEFGNSVADAKITLLRPTTPPPPVVSPPVSPPPVSPPPVSPPPVTSPPPVSPPPPPVSPPPPPPDTPLADLTPTVVSATLPESVPYGTKVKGKLVVRVTNAGELSLAGLVPVSVRLSATDSPVLGDTEVTRIFKNMNLKPGRSTVLKIPISQLPTVAPGSYHLGVILDPESAITEKSETNNAAATSQTFAVAAPFVDVSSTFHGMPTKLEPGRKGTITLDLGNDGNVLASGTVAVEVVASLDSKLDDSDVSLAAGPVKINLRPGDRKAGKVKLFLPSSLTAGNYYLIAKIDPDNLLPESDKNNNLSSVGPLSL